MSDLRVLYDGRYSRMVRREGWEFVQRKGVSGIVGIVAVTDEGKILLVEQYRPPVGSRVIEIPAGLVGDVEGSEDEPLAEAARRELEEETGYRAAEMEHLADGTASAGLTDEIITLFRARGLTKMGGGGGDEQEDIEVHAVAVGDVMRFLEERKKRGVLVDLKVYAAMWFVERV